MKQLLTIALLTVASILSAHLTVNITVSNPSTSARTDEPVIITLAPYSSFGDIRSALVTTGDQEIPYQLDDLDQNEVYDELCFLVNLNGLEKKTYQLQLFSEGVPRPYPARVFAEMLVRNDKIKEKNKHNNYLESITVRGDCANSYNVQHHHGVDFESELNGIRIYFDKRQTPDLYGKFHKRLELEATQFYTQPVQKRVGYGDDVLWVGNTFGLGAFRGWDGHQPTMIDPVRSRTQRIIAYGPLRTIVEIYDRGWQAVEGKPVLNMLLRYIQYAGHRDTDVEVIFNRTVGDYLFSTGIINVKGSEAFSDQKGLRACWGTDWPSSDHENFKPETVGLGIYIPQQFIRSEEPANKDNYAFVLGTDEERLTYKIIYCSDNEDFGYHSSKEWFEFLQDWKQELEMPLVVEIKAPR